MTTTLETLLQRSRRLADQASVSLELPAIKRGIEQIEAHSRRLASQVTPLEDGPRVTQLLASKGVDTAELFTNIAKVDVALAFDSLQYLTLCDIEVISPSSTVRLRVSC